MDLFLTVLLRLNNISAILMNKILIKIITDGNGTRRDRTPHEPIKMFSSSSASYPSHSKI